MAEGIRFIRKGGRIIPIRKKGPSKEARVGAISAATGAGVGVHGILSAEIHANRAARSAAFSKAFEYKGKLAEAQILKDQAKSFATKAVKANKRVALGYGLYAAGAAILGHAGYKAAQNNYKKKPSKVKSALGAAVLPVLSTGVAVAFGMGAKRMAGTSIRGYMRGMMKGAAKSTSSAASSSSKAVAIYKKGGK